MRETRSLCRLCGRAVPAFEGHDGRFVYCGPDCAYAGMAEAVNRWLARPGNRERQRERNRLSMRRARARG